MSDCRHYAVNHIHQTVKKHNYVGSIRPIDWAQYKVGGIIESHAVAKLPTNSNYQ